MGGVVRQLVGSLVLSWPGLATPANPLDAVAARVFRRHLVRSGLPMNSVTCSHAVPASDVRSASKEGAAVAWAVAKRRVGMQSPGDNSSRPKTPSSRGRLPLKTLALCPARHEKQSSNPLKKIYFTHAKTALIYRNQMTYTSWNIKTDPRKGRQCLADRMELAKRFRGMLSDLGLKPTHAAKLLHVSLRTIHNWTSGKHQIPVIAYKTLRMMRYMELPGKSWEGWHFSRGILVTPEGHQITGKDGSWWSLLVRRAAMFDQTARENQRLRCELAAKPPNLLIEQCRIIFLPS